MIDSLKTKTIRGTIWSAADALLGYGVTFVVGIILARLLTPAEYGLIGICTIFTTILLGVVDSGFSTALIRKKNVSNDDYNTMFFTNLLMSVLLFLLLYVTSPIIAVFFGRLELTAILRAMGFVLILQALSIVQVTKLTKNIDFKTKTKASLISSICSGIIAIAMAFNNYGVWSLVGLNISKQLCYSLCLCWLNKWIPKFVFNFDSFRYMWGFGWKMMLSGLLSNIWAELYQVVVGKFYSPSTLGQYTRAKEYASLFSANFTSIIQRVSFPTLSELQDTEERLVYAYRKIIKLSMFITTLCMFFLAAVSEPFIYCLIGSKWSDAAHFLPLICISLSLYPLHAINLNMLKVQGRSDIFLIIEIVKKILSIFPICCGIFIGIYSMLVGSIIIGILSFFLNSYYTGKKLNYSSWKQIKDVTPSYTLAISVAISVYFLKYIPTSFFIILPLQLLVGMIVLFIICEYFHIDEYIEIRKIIVSYKDKIWKK